MSALFQKFWFFCRVNQGLRDTSFVLGCACTDLSQLKHHIFFYVGGILNGVMERVRWPRWYLNGQIAPCEKKHRFPTPGQRFLLRNENIRTECKNSVSVRPACTAAHRE